MRTGMVHRQANVTQGEPWRPFRNPEISKRFLGWGTTCFAQEPSRDDVSIYKIIYSAFILTSCSTKVVAKDLPGMYGWLQAPHVREFYHTKPLPSWQETRAHYLQRLDPNWPTRCFSVWVDRAIGYIQTYRIADYPDYAATIGETEGISVDLFIGEPQYIGNGWGR